MEEKNESITVKYRLSGTVQGVGFRNYLQQLAEDKKLRGFAANEKDGSVIVLLHGKKEDISEIYPLMQEGPKDASVIAVTELLLDATDKHEQPFAIL